MEDLTGTPVVVHPLLTTDPINMQGIIGVISHINYPEESIYVKFQNKMLGHYAPDALIMLVPPQLILDRLRMDIDDNDLSRQELVDILGIYLLYSTGHVEDRKTALDWAYGNSNYDSILFTVGDWISYQTDMLNNRNSYSKGI